MRWSFPIQNDSQPDHVAGEVFFLWCFRSWVRGLCDKDAEHWTAVWNESARRFGAADGRHLVSSLVRCVNVLREHAASNFAYHHPCCPLRSVEEAALVDMVAAISAGQGRRAVGQAQTLVRPEGVAEIVQAATRLSQVLRRHGVALGPACGSAVNAGALSSGTVTLH